MRRSDNTEKVAATGFLRPLDLSDWGYPIDEVSPSFLTKSFFQADGVYMNSPNTGEDVDGDGFDRWDDMCPMTGGAWSGFDRDGDGIADHCDPAPSFQSVYVAGGGDGLPAVGPSSLTFGQDLLEWKAVDRAGYLDADEDGRPDGEDLCPFRPGGATDRNQWGETTSWDPLESVANGRNDQLGVFYRGDQCDPYPHARPIWVSGTQWEHSPWESHCREPGWRTYGASEVRIAHQAGQGISSNDLSTSFADPPTPYWTQTFRCACDTAVGSECVEDPSSACFRNTVEPAADHTPPSWGRAWRPIDLGAGPKP